MALNDQYLLSQDVTFKQRVQASLMAACVAIANEGWAVVFHRERSLFANNILSTTTIPNPYVTLFTNSVATDATVISDATQAGTVTLTSGNAAAQAALVTDTHINNAVSSQFNAYIREPNS